MVAQKIQTVTGQAMTVVCQALGMSRRMGYYVRRERPPGRYQRAEDAMVLQQNPRGDNSRALERSGAPG